MKIFMIVLMFLSFTFTSCISEDDPVDVEKEDKSISETADEDVVEVDPDKDSGEVQPDEDGGETVNDHENDQPELDEEVTQEDPDEDGDVEPCTDYATNFPLMPGDCVPDFTIPAQDGVTMVTLSDYRGMFVLFSSFPMAATPVCTGQMQKLDEMYHDFIAENIQPFGLNNESPDKKEGWCETMGIQNLLILADHDPKDAVSIMFGIAGGMTARANTVIGPDGRFVMKKSCMNSACIPAILEDIKAVK